VLNKILFTNYVVVICKPVEVSCSKCQWITICIAITCGYILLAQLLTVVSWSQTIQEQEFQSLQFHWANDFMAQGYWRNKPDTVLVVVVWQQLPKAPLIITPPHPAVFSFHHPHLVCWLNPPFSFLGPSATPSDARSVITSISHGKCKSKAATDAYSKMGSWKWSCPPSVAVKAQ